MINTIKYKRLFFPILTSLISTLVFGQARYSFQQYSINQGLSQSQVTCLFEDSRGFLWCGTSGGGLCRFDGQNFKAYNQLDGLDGQIVNTVTEDTSGNLWIGATWGGLTKFDGKTFTSFTMQNGLPNNDVTSIYIESNDKIWIGTRNGLAIKKGNVIKNFSDIPELKKYNIYQILQDNSGTIWIATSNGLVLYDKELGFFVPNFQDGSNLLIKKMYKNASGNIILITAKNKVFAANSLQSKTIVNKPFFFSDSLSKYDITSVIFNPQRGEYYFGTRRHGILTVNKTKFTHLNRNNGLNAENISCLYIDPNNIFWIGTSGSGLLSLKNRSFINYNYSERPLKDIFAICQGNGNDLWIGTLNSGLFKLHNGIIEKIGNYKYLNSSVSLAYDTSKEILWIASSNGLIQYKDGIFKRFTTKDGLASNNIISLLMLHNGNLAIGTFGAGMSVYDGKEFKTYNKQNGLNGIYVHSLLEDDKGNLWIGTGDFAYKFDGSSFTPFTSHSDFCNAYIGSMAMDKLGHIWFATDRCVNMYDGVDFKTYTINDGLNSNTIYSVCSDKNGDIWVGTNMGLNKIVINSYGNINGIKSYTRNNGFNGIECNTNAALCDRKGNMWFGTVNGLFEYNPKAKNKINNKPKMYITDIEINNKTYINNSTTESGWFHLPKSPKFKHNDNNITINYLSIFKPDPSQIVYSYRLKGISSYWSASTSNTYVNYSNLPSGKYIFQIKSLGANGKWSDITEFKFAVKTPLWQEWWFYIICVLILIYIIYKIITSREEKRVKLQKKLEEMVTERTKEIRKQKDEKELLLKEVHHRVKNNMQVINSLINLQLNYVKDEMARQLFEECKNRISSMALIHEKLYQSKDLKNVSIEDYFTNLVNHLIAVYELDAKIELEENIEIKNFTLDTLIPLGLILNEIISNTLKYAFDARDQRKKHIISFSLKRLKDNDCEIIIGDNGKGFDHKIFKSHEGTLGIELILILTEQLSGKIELLDKEGSWYKINFKT